MAITLYLAFVRSMYVGGPYNQITYHNSVNNEWSDKMEGQKENNIKWNLNDSFRYPYLACVLSHSVVSDYLQPHGL